jgi:dolichol-phosphate mannosyltransferase
VPTKLLVVVPVFNEERCIENVLREWQRAISEIEPNYCFLLLDDGSTDRTRALIEEWASRQNDGTCRIISHANRGHGQTCLEGYRVACDLCAEWVLQIDSDGQCDPKFLAELWANRPTYDVVYGQRVKRQDGWKRILASTLVRMVVRFSSGIDCTDANVPYRLMRTEKLLPLVESIPSNFDLANIALAVQIKRAGWRECAVPIVFLARTGGEPSVPISRFAVKAVELYRQLKSLSAPSMP